jgi:hypothetical protein
MTKSELREMIREVVKEELASRNSEGINEGIFDKKDSAEYKNTKMEFNSKVKEITDGKADSLDVIARTAAGLISDAYATYVAGMKQDDNHATDSLDVNRFFQATRKELATLIDAIIRESSRLSISAVVRKIKSLIDNKLAHGNDFFNTSSILDTLDEYAEQMRTVEKTFENTDNKTMKLVYKDACKLFIKAAQNSLQQEKQALERMRESAESEEALLENVFENLY